MPKTLIGFAQKIGIDDELRYFILCIRLGFSLFLGQKQILGSKKVNFKFSWSESAISFQE